MTDDGFFGIIDKAFLPDSLGQIPGIRKKQFAGTGIQNILLSGDIKTDGHADRTGRSGKEEQQKKDKTNAGNAFQIIIHDR
jgi:hypothetical protein